MKKLKLLLLTLFMLLNVGVALSQVTTSGITGVIDDEENSTLPGATVLAIHEPSGTQYGVATNVFGQYTIQGMRPGGPYTVTVNFVGKQPQVFNDIYLSLGEVYKINATLVDDSKELQEVVVVSKNKFDSNKTGAGSRTTAEDIQNTPSISHSISDAIRLNPQLSVGSNGAMSFAGTNNRYNSFQIDGAVNNDVFGLTSNGSNGGLAGAQPISMETVEQIQVSVAPFDVRQSGFTGGAINAITKSGTNDFHGSVYFDGLNQNLYGTYELYNGKESEKMDDITEYRVGATVGGPIVKNKLFFFVNYEHSDSESPNRYGLGSPTSKVDVATANELLAFLRSKGYTGSLTSIDNYRKSEKAGIKIDYNIGSKHKATFGWRLVDAKQLNKNSSASSLVASDYPYDYVSKTNNFTAELNSRFSSNINNEFRFSYVRVRDNREPKGAFPQVSISGVGDGSINFGTEYSSAANGLDQDAYTITDNLTWYLGTHTLTFGTHNEIYKFSNLFIPYLYGTYYFDTPQQFYDFANGVEGATFKNYYYGMADEAITGDKRWAAQFGAAQFGVYVQDKWRISDRFDLTYGIRFDIPVAFDTPVANEPFNEYAASQGWDVRTDHKIKNTPLVSPRIGFHYDLDDKGINVLRGGVGMFTGRIPFVWLSNNISNTGIQLISYSASNGKGVFVTDPYDQSPMYSTLKASGSQTINVFADDFKFAQSLRFNLAADLRLGGIDWTIEGILSKTINDVVYKDYARDLDGSTVNEMYGLGFDDRPTLTRVTVNQPFNRVIYLDNTNKGYSVSASLKGEKHFQSGLSLMASYTYTNSKSVNSGSNSVAWSNYRYNYIYTNPNDPELGYSAYNVPHRIVASVTYSKDYASHWRSTISLIYTGTSGIPYSINISGDLNGDGSDGNDLLYIPTDAQIDNMPFLSTYDEATGKGYSEEQQRANLKAWIASEDYLADHRGEYFERYADNEKFENHFDLHLAQRFSFNVGKSQHAIEFSFDVLNISNMFSKKWGRASNSAGYYSPISFSKGQYQFLHNADYNMRSYNDINSRWRGQFGIKYIF